MNWSTRQNTLILDSLLMYSWDGAVDVVITLGWQYKVASFPLTESVEETVHLLHILKPQLVLPIQLTHLEIAG